MQEVNETALVKTFKQKQTKEIQNSNMDDKRLNYQIVNNVLTTHGIKDFDAAAINVGNRSKSTTYHTTIFKNQVLNPSPQIKLKNKINN